MCWCALHSSNYVSALLFPRSQSYANHRTTRLASMVSDAFIIKFTPIKFRILDKIEAFKRMDDPENKDWAHQYKYLYQTGAITQESNACNWALLLDASMAHPAYLLDTPSRDTSYSTKAADGFSRRRPYCLSHLSRCACLCCAHQSTTPHSAARHCNF